MLMNVACTWASSGQLRLNVCAREVIPSWKRARIPRMLLLYSVTASPYAKMPMLLPHEEIDFCPRLSRLVRQSWQMAVTKRTCCADPLDATASGDRMLASGKKSRMVVQKVKA